ncbi:MAG: copper resistance protein CopD [Halobacteria archaeon]|nr:copper resistance protein CopD [Halobacteria archaeon]
MSLIDNVMASLHVIFAAVWIGSALFMAGVVVPAARDGKMSSELASHVADRFSLVSIVGSAVMFVTGGHMAGTMYNFGALLNTVGGNLVLTMVVLWFLVSGFLHMATKKLKDGVDEDRVRTPAKNSLVWYRISAVLGFLLLVNGALLSFVY